MNAQIPSAQSVKSVVTFYLQILRWHYFTWTYELVARFGRLIRRPWIAGYGRHSNLFPVHCLDCLKVSRQKNCIHSYQSCGEDDVEGVDECPYCYSDDLSPTFGGETKTANLL